MKFVRLTKNVLVDLKRQGYNILTSVNTVDDEDPTYTPVKVDSVWDYLDNVTVVPLSEPEIIVIDEALENYSDDMLRGMVLIEKA